MHLGNTQIGPGAVASPRIDFKLPGMNHVISNIGPSQNESNEKSIDSNGSFINTDSPRQLSAFNRSQQQQ